MTEADLVIYLDSKDFDVRKTQNGRWIDQKCTPDVVWSAADFIMVYIENNGQDCTFTVKDIWKSEYAKAIVKEQFSKPDTDSKKVENEFDKFFSQPINLLCYAGAIKDISNTKKHLYKLDNHELLEYISRSEIYSYRFLCCYIEKVLKDSALYPAFEYFFNDQTQNSYDHVKSTFEQFCYDNTKIRNKKETGRIFTKIINPLACKYGKKGTKRGCISKHAIPKQDLMYNNYNFRDIYRDKPKNVSRKEWMEQQKKTINTGVLEQQMSAAKRMLKEFNDLYRDGISELTMFSDNHSDTVHATQIHHIFPKAQFAIIMAYLENLTAITPNQHFGFAHPENKTGSIDLEAQRQLLLAKTCSIKSNLSSDKEEHIYTFDNLLFVLSVGFSDEEILDIDENDYLSVIQTINAYYYSINK